MVCLKISEPRLHTTSVLVWVSILLACPMNFRLKTVTSIVTWISSLPASPTNFRLASHHDCVCQVLKTNLNVNINIYLIDSIFLRTY